MVAAIFILLVIYYRIHCIIAWYVPLSNGSKRITRFNSVSFSVNILKHKVLLTCRVLVYSNGNAKMDFCL